MFVQAVAGDPANLIYLDAMFENLRELYGDKKNRKARVSSSRAPFKKAHTERRWQEVISLGLQLLGENPWDIPTLRGMADACEALHYNEVELRYLKNALDSNPKDLDVNRHCAKSLARMGQYDQAIACWHRVEELQPGKAEAPRMISQLTVEKNRVAAGLAPDGSPSSSGVLAKSGGTSTARGTAANADAEKKSATLPVTRESLERAIVADPANTKNYLALADWHEKSSDWQEAERVLRRAVQVAGNDLVVRERLEETQLRIAHRQLAVAQRRAGETNDESARQLAEQLQQDINRQELAMYESRCRRYPDKLALHYELAVRLKRAHVFEEAAKEFQTATAVPSLAAAATVHLGECQQQLRQYQPALESYLKGKKLAEADGATETVKLALFRAGVLAAAMKQAELARQCLSELVALDANYRDARSRLDKLAAN